MIEKEKFIKAYEAQMKYLKTRIRELQDKEHISPEHTQWEIGFLMGKISILKLLIDLVKDGVLIVS